MKSFLIFAGLASFFIGYYIDMYTSLSWYYWFPFFIGFAIVTLKIIIPIANRLENMNPNKYENDPW